MTSLPTQVSFTNSSGFHTKLITSTHYTVMSFRPQYSSLGEISLKGDNSFTKDAPRRLLDLVNNNRLFHSSASLSWFSSWYCFNKCAEIKRNTRRTLTISKSVSQCVSPQRYHGMSQDERIRYKRQNETTAIIIEI